MKRPFSNADGEIIYVPALTLNSTGNNEVNKLQKMYQVVHKMGYSYRKAFYVYNDQIVYLY